VSSFYETRGRLSYHQKMIRPALSPVYSLHKVPTAKKTDNTLLYEYEVRYIPAEVVQAESHCLRLADDIYDDYFYKPAMAKKMAWRQKNRRSDEPIAKTEQQRLSLAKNIYPPPEALQKALENQPKNERGTADETVFFPGTIAQAFNPKELQQRVTAKLASGEDRTSMDELTFQYINPSNRTRHQQETLEEIYYQRARSSSLSTLGEVRRVIAHARKKRPEPPDAVPGRAATNPKRSESVLGHRGSREKTRQNPHDKQGPDLLSNPLALSDSFAVSKCLCIKPGRIDAKISQAARAKTQEPLIPVERVALPQCKTFGTSALILSRSQSLGTKSLLDTTLTGIPLSTEEASAYTPLYIGGSHSRSSGIGSANNIVKNMFEPIRSSTLALHNSRLSRDSTCSAIATPQTLDPRPSLTTNNLSREYPDLKDKLVENVLNTLRSSILTISDLDPDMTLRESNSNGLKASVIEQLLTSKSTYRDTGPGSVPKLAIDPATTGTVKRVRRTPRLQSTPITCESHQRTGAKEKEANICLQEGPCLDPVLEARQRVQTSDKKHRPADSSLESTKVDLFITQSHSLHGDGSDEAIYIELGMSTPLNLSEQQN
ncbi:Hypothetical protein GSB_16638, partial [Giardia duodenalis]